jgi:hypothetical protein
LVVDWAPQVEVLKHAATGMFLVRGRTLPSERSRGDALTPDRPIVVWGASPRRLSRVHQSSPCHLVRTKLRLPPTVSHTRTLA